MTKYLHTSEFINYLAPNNYCTIAHAFVVSHVLLMNSASGSEGVDVLDFFLLRSFLFLSDWGTRYVTPGIDTNQSPFDVVTVAKETL